MIYSLAAFKSQNDAAKAFAALTESGIESSLISTPSAVKAGCGVSVRFSVESASAVLARLSELKLTTFIGIFTVTQTAGQTIIVKS